MKNKLLIKSIMIAPLALTMLVVMPKAAHADAYSVDPRFVGNPDIGKNMSISTRYSFHHGGNPVLGSDNIWRGGYWAGATNVSLQYKYISINQMVVLQNGASASTYDNSATIRGGGFYDTNFLGKFGYQGWTQSGVSQPEKKSNYDYSSGLMSYISNQSNGIWYGSTHYNASTAFTRNVYYYERQSGVQSQYLVYGDSNHNFTPFSWINRYFLDNHTQARWDAGPLGNISLSGADIKWINNTTGADNYTSYKQGYVIAPGGSYNINDNHDSDTKMLSWPTGGSNGKYYTTGDKLVLRNMSPIIQAGGENYGKSKNGALTTFQPNQVFRQALWIPDGFDYNLGDAKVYAIQTDGSKIDVTNRFTEFYGTYGGTDTVTNWSQDGSTSTNMRRLVFTAKNINDDSTGGYNNAKTVGYSVMVPVTVNATAHTDKPYAIRGGSQIINGVWHDTGTDKIYIWNPSKPVSTTTSSNATVFKNDSSSDFTENTLFYDGDSFANNKTFRSNESDGYYVWHRMIASAAVPDYVLNNKASDSSIAPWQSTQPLVFTIPYDSRYVTPIGGSVSRNMPTWTTMNVGTNGITGQDTGSSYVITIPASLVNAYRNQNVDWGAVLKYKVKTGIPGDGVQVSSTGSSNDEVSGVQNGNTIYNYLESPNSTFTFDTVSPYGDHATISQFGSNLNNSVHFVNGQEYGYEAQFNKIAKMSGSTGVGEPLKTVKLTASVKPNQIVNTANVYKGNTLVWSGYVRIGSASLQGSSRATIGGLSASDWASSFNGTITTNDNNPDHNRVVGIGKTVTVTATDDLLNNKTALYDTDDLRLVLLTDTDDSNNQTNLTNKYGDLGNALTASLTTSNGITSDLSSTLSQQVSRVKPGAMIVKHNQWPASLNDDGSSINLNDSSIQGREVFDYRLSQFLGNASLPTEGYPTSFSLNATYNIQAQPTGVSDVTVKAYDLAGNVSDVTKDFTITINDGKVSALMNNDAVKSVTGKVGSAYNKLYVLNVPMKNQTDNSSTVRNEINGSAMINGQTVKAPYIDEFIPPETPYMYGYSATSSADSFAPSDPEKDKGKIAYGTSDGASTSAQISTAPVQWVIREQLGDMSNPKNPQKYDYAKFSATFPDAALFQNGASVTWHVYNESGVDVTSKFTGATTSGTGFKIQASSAFLKDMSNYGHKYYFVINQTTQNNHANRLAMAVKAGLGNVYTAFRNLKSAMSSFFGSVGIGNTDKTVATQNFDMQSDLNLLQINSTKSGLNEKTSELNSNPFTNGKYTIQNVQLARPLSGYTVTGAASQYATDARAYESYTTSFVANGADNAQAVTAGSVRVIDSVTNTDVTSEYNVTVNDQKVILVASQKALDRLHGYHKTAANADTQDIVTFHVDTWGTRQSDTVATWYATHNINSYNDAQSVERVTIPQAHAGHKEIYVSPAGQNKWQTSDMTLSSISDAIDLKIRVTVPNDLHNKDFSDFIAHYVGSEITPFVNQADATATVMLGENNDYSKGSAMVPTNANASSNSLNNSRVLWQLPSTLVTQLNTTNAINAAPTYTVIIHNIRFTPTNARTIDQYIAYLNKNNQVVIPVGGVTTSSSGSQSLMDGNYFEGRNGAIVDSTIGSLGSGTTLGDHSGRINIILPSATASQEGYVNGGESNTSFTSTGAN